MKPELPKLHLLKFSFFLFTFFAFTSQICAQQLYVGSEGQFFLGKALSFTTSGTSVTSDPGGSFSLEAGNKWGSAEEFVEGEVSVLGNGESIIPVGDKGTYAPVSVVHSADVTAAYFNESPSAGGNGIGVGAVGDVEYWKLSGSGAISLPWNESSDISTLVNDNGGKLSALAIVGLSGDTWNLAGESQSYTIEGDLLSGSLTSDASIEIDLGSFSEITFGIDEQLALSVNELFLSTGIEILTNPVLSQDKNIRFQTTGELQDLRVDLYDLRGRLVRSYETISGNGQQGELPVEGVKSGLYFAKFVQDGKQGVKKLIIE